jgi:hypothetical protein
MKHSRKYSITASVITIVMILYWLGKSTFGIISGIPGAVNDLIIVGIVLGFFFLTRKLLFWSGLFLSLMGVVLAIYFFLFQTTYQAILPHLLLMCTPTTIAGLLFIEADWSSKKKI